MRMEQEAKKTAQDAFQSMVGGTGPYPDDPQHPDPSYDVDASPMANMGAGRTCTYGMRRKDKA